MRMIIDKLSPETPVSLRFAGRGGKPSDERAVFVKLTGTGDDRRATFRQKDVNDNPYEWDAYRDGGHWVYGSSAQRLSLIGVGE